MKEQGYRSEGLLVIVINSDYWLVTSRCTAQHSTSAMARSSATSNARLDTSPRLPEASPSLLRQEVLGTLPWRFTPRTHMTVVSSHSYSCRIDRCSTLRITELELMQVDTLMSSY